MTWMHVHHPMLLQVAEGATDLRTKEWSGTWLVRADYDAAPFTTFSSIFQSLGRLSGGVVSEYNLQVHGTSRATSFGIWVAMFSLSSIVFAFTDSIGMLYVTVPMSTFTFGGVITIFAPLCSELFGLLNMGMIYTVLRASVFVGSLVFG
eukprot:gene10191-12056_t